MIKKFFIVILVVLIAFLSAYLLYSMWENMEISNKNKKNVAEMLKMAEELQTKLKAGEKVPPAADSQNTQKGWPSAPFYFASGKGVYRVVSYADSLPRDVEDDSSVFLYCFVDKDSVSPVYADLAAIPIDARFEMDSYTPKQWPQGFLFMDSPEEACYYLPGAKMIGGKCQVS